MPDFPRHYLFLGPELGQKAEAVEELRTRWCALHPGGVEEHRLRSGDVAVARLVSLLQNGSLFYDALFVTYSDIESLKKDELALLKDYLAGPNPACLLVLQTAEVKADTDLQKRFGKNEVRIFWEMFENQRKGWVLGYFRNRGYTLDDEAAEFFLDMVGNTTDVLKAEADRLLLFHPEGRPITLEVLEEYLQHSREETPFTLFEAMAEARLDNALEILQKLFLSGETQFAGVILLLTRQWKTFYQFLIDQDRALPAETSFTQLKVFSKRAQAILKNAAKVFSTTEAEAVYRLTQTSDLEVRQARTEDKKMLVELYLYKAIQRRGSVVAPMVALPLL